MKSADSDLPSADTSHATVPADHADAMVAAGPAGIGYNSDTSPFYKLPMEAARRTDLHFLRIERPGLSLELSYGGAF